MSGISPGAAGDLQLAERLVRTATGVALELRGAVAQRKWLATDVVTEADRRAERALVEILRAERPRDGVDGRPIRVPPAPPLAEATVATFVDARRRDGDTRAATEAPMRGVAALRAVGSGTLELAWVAAGPLHAWVQPDTEPWDWHAGALLVAEAGGVARVSGRWHVAAAGEGLARELEALL